MRCVPANAMRGRPRRGGISRSGRRRRWLCPRRPRARGLSTKACSRSAAVCAGAGLRSGSRSPVAARRLEYPRDLVICLAARAGLDGQGDRAGSPASAPTKRCADPLTRGERRDRFDHMFDSSDGTEPSRPRRVELFAGPERRPDWSNKLTEACRRVSAYRSWINSVLSADRQ